MFKSGTEDVYVVKVIHKNYVVDKDLGSEDAIFANGKLLMSSTLFVKLYIFILTVSATEEILK